MKTINLGDATTHLMTQSRSIYCMLLFQPSEWSSLSTIRLPTPLSGTYYKSSALEMGRAVFSAESIKFAPRGDRFDLLPCVRPTKMSEQGRSRSLSVWFLSYSSHGDFFVVVVALSAGHKLNLGIITRCHHRKVATRPVAAVSWWLDPVGAPSESRTPRLMSELGELWQSGRGEDAGWDDWVHMSGYSTSPRQQ